MFDGPPSTEAIRNAIRDVEQNGSRATAQNLRWVRSAARNAGSLGGQAGRALDRHNLPRTG